MKISFDESKNIIPSGRKHYTCNYCIDHFKTKFVLIHHIHPSCNHCIQYLKRKFVLMHHTQCSNMMKIVLLQSPHLSHPNLICFDSSQDIPTCRKWYSAFATSKLNSFWFIREGPNMWKTVFLQSLHTILQNKICFDALHNVPTCRKWY